MPRKTNANFETIDERINLDTHKDVITSIYRSDFVWKRIANPKESPYAKYIFSGRNIKPKSRGKLYVLFSDLEEKRYVVAVAVEAIETRGDEKRGCWIISYRVRNVANFPSIVSTDTLVTTEKILSFEQMQQETELTVLVRIALIRGAQNAKSIYKHKNSTC